MPRRMKFTTPAEAVRDDARYWLSRSVEERFLAVGVICEAAYFLRHGRKLPRLDRSVIRYVDFPPPEPRVTKRK